MGWHYRLLIFLFIALTFKARATHIVGGEIYYTCLGGNAYQVTLKVYRDCYLGQAGFDNPAIIGVYDGDKNLLQTIQLQLPGFAKLPITVTNPCYKPPQVASVCVEEAVYTDIITLAPNTTGYYLAYQRCCRNNSILNLDDPGAQGATYMAYVPPALVVTCNSSPRYKNFPPIAICLGKALEFDHSATDPDGDLLVYEMCTPFIGGSKGDPAPNPPSGPPYFDVTYKSPYTGSSPMSSSPAITIDPTTGLLTGTPDKIGQWVVGVCVKEYRNGVLISTNKRDFQFNVVNCELITVSAVPSQQTFCTGGPIEFGNSSVNGWNYQWNFGDPTTTTDVSTQMRPTYTYPAIGTYTVSLIANPGTICADTTQMQAVVAPLLAPEFSPPTSQCFSGNSFDFMAGGSFTNSAAFSWFFGAGNTPPSSSQQNPMSVQFSSPGTHTVSLTVYENGCTKMISHPITVFPLPEAAIQGQQEFCKGFTFNFTNNSTNGASYSWNFGDPSSGTDNSSLTNPVYSYPDSGRYSVSLVVISPDGCIDSTRSSFYIYPLLAPQFVPPTGECLNVNSYDFTAGGFFMGTNTSFQWDFGASATPASTSQQNVNNVVWSQPGHHLVSLTVMENNCIETFTDTVVVHPMPVAEVVPQDDYCFGQTVEFGNISVGGDEYFWDFGDPGSSQDTSRQAEPVYMYSSTGSFTAQLIVETQFGCKDTTYVTYKIEPLLAPSFMAPDTQCFVGHSFDFVAGGSFEGSGSFHWDFGPGASPASSSLTNPTGITYPAPGTYPVLLTISENDCVKSYTDSVTVHPMPVSQFAAVPGEACIPFVVRFESSSTAATPLSYLWHFGDGTTSTLANPYHTYTEAGTYDVTLIAYTTNGCIASDTFFVPGLITARPLPTAGFVTEPMAASIFEPYFTVTDSSRNAVSCTYSFGDGFTLTESCDYMHTYKAPGFYSIRQIVVNEYQCTDTAEMVVEVKHEHRFFVPNAFTPNNNGLNDVFRPAVFGVEEYDLMIFDRWGELIFRTNDPEGGWDGTLKGNPCQQDVYVWRIAFRDLVDNRHQVHIGHVTLIR